jgi:hypothetical protein
MQKIMHYSVVWNDLHEYYRLKVFAELMKNYHQVEQEENKKEKNKRARHLREDYRKVLEKLIQTDQFTFRSKYQELFPKLKDEESFYGTLGEEVSSPREVFLFYKYFLIDNQKKIKEYFKNLLKGNLQKFPVGIEYEKFKEILEKEKFFNDLDTQADSNSLDFYSKYLFKKMEKRHEKSVLKFMKFLYYQSNIRDSSKNQKQFLKSLKKALKTHEDKSYFESISEEEKLKWIQEFQSYVKEGKNLKQLIRSWKEKSKKKTNSVKSTTPIKGRLIL